MKRISFSVLLVLGLSAFWPVAIAGQEQSPGCKFSIAGTWQSSSNGRLNPTRARFGANGVMTELSPNAGNGPDWQTSAKFRYMLDNAQAPKTMVLTKIVKSDKLHLGATLEITTFDDGMFVTRETRDGGGELTRWTRIDPYRYFVVLAAGKGSPGFGGPGFAMLIKTDGVHAEKETFGTWPVVNPRERHPEIGRIPEEFVNQFENEPVNDSGSMFRLEVTAGPYNRALGVMKSWQRRVDENQLLYPTIPYLNNAVYLNQLTSSLNEAGVLSWKGGTTCSETIKLQKLTWLLNDPIVARHNLTQTPYYLFKTLRELNSSQHLSDSQFHAALTGNPSTGIAISSR